MTDGPEGKNCVRTTTYHAFALFKPHRSKASLRVETEGTSPLALSATASKGDGELVLSFVNPQADTDMQIDCALHGVSAKAGTAQIVQDPDPTAYNSFEQPNRVVPRALPVNVEASRVQLDLPRLSVATVVLRTA